MKKIIRLTESDLFRIVKRVIMESKENDPVGSEWKSCRVWNSTGKSKYGDFFSFTKSNSLIEIGYSGPKSGLVISHSKNGTDTIHQVFNVLICELNPYLAKIKAKPDIENITYETSMGGPTESQGYNYNIFISIPLKKSNKLYEIYYIIKYHI